MAAQILVAGVARDALRRATLLRQNSFRRADQDAERQPLSLAARKMGHKNRHVPAPEDYDVATLNRKSTAFEQ